MDTQESPYTRVITIGTDQQGDKDRIAVLVKCESFIARVVEYSIMVETGADPFRRR